MCQVFIKKRRYFSLQMFLIREIVLINDLLAIFAMVRFWVGCFFLFVCLVAFCLFVLVVANTPKEGTKKTK